VAEKYQSHGFRNVKALLGGVEAWKSAGYGIVPSQSS
jgi:rhodanese-related sulfurtransferase